MNAFINLDTNEVTIEINTGDKLADNLIYGGPPIKVRSILPKEEVDEALKRINIKNVTA